MESFLKSLERKERRFLRIKPFLIILILGNLIGALVGFLYYFETIRMAELYHWAIWILVPDCPMAVFLLCFVYLQGERQQFGNYNFFAFIQGIRGAVITFLLITNFPSIDIEIVILGHLFLMLQSIAILPLLINMKLGIGTVIAVLITIINDFLDFFGIVGLFQPTLAQYPTFTPKFDIFITTIYGLDIILIIIGIGVAYLYSSSVKQDRPSLSSRN
jgi:uncharacterized membrane protein YpjA